MWCLDLARKMMIIPKDANLPPDLEQRLVRAAKLSKRCGNVLSSIDVVASIIEQWERDIQEEG